MLSEVDTDYPVRLTIEGNHIPQNVIQEMAIPSWINLRVVLYYQQEDLNASENSSNHYYKLTLSDNLWLEQARDFGSFCFGIDSKYDLNSDRAPVLSLVVEDNAGYRTPIAFGISNKENNHTIRLAIEAVQQNIPCNNTNCLHEYYYKEITNSMGFIRIRNCAPVWQPFAMMGKHQPTKRGLNIFYEV
ncbi:gephyrin: PROVISIONAL [Gigaspora margarita]|uniref:Gephyrin: PROVISIONAL n=1 Tax=Gigaspora margarita TaxID=4874 RepID=A0A8H4EVK1_GIGMA|nr:gephyrin: PROVISIONAL [Gigaspora margarita]